MTRLATIRLRDKSGVAGTRAVRLEAEILVEIGFPDLGAYLAAGSPDVVDGPIHHLEDADFAPVVPNPSKVICVGDNYFNHIKEMGHGRPAHPTLFPKFADTLIGAYDDIVKHGETDALDWEVKLVVVVSKPVRYATEEEAADAIAGFTVMNDVTVRDWQSRTIEWTQGKIWDSPAPVGPFLVSPDDVGGVRPSLTVTTTVDGQVTQQDDTGTLLFDPVHLVQYVSTIVRLNPGDLVATGTPARVGHARDPKVYLVGGETVVTRIEGLGACVNKVVERRDP